MIKTNNFCENNFIPKFVPNCPLCNVPVLCVPESTLPVRSTSMCANVTFMSSAGSIPRPEASDAIATISANSTSLPF